MKKLFFQIFFLFTMAHMFAQTTKKDFFWIDSSYVHITGTSNVMDYSCELIDLSNNNNLHIESLQKGKSRYLKNAKISIHSNLFKCNNKPLTKNFLAAIKASTHPFIYIEFISFYFEQYTEKVPHQRNVKANIMVTLAGEEINYSIVVDEVIVSSSGITFKGSHSMLMSDFNIEPPTAILGTVKADDRVEIIFEMTFKRKK